MNPPFALGDRVCVPALGCSAVVDGHHIDLHGVWWLRLRSSSASKSGGVWIRASDIEAMQ